MNPVQFKITSDGMGEKTELHGMTVFNREPSDTKKQPMFFGRNLLAFKDTIHTNILFLKN